MSTTLAALLAGYAVESGEMVGKDPIAEDPSLIGAEEITIVTDNTTTELEEALEEVSEKVEKLEDNGAGAEKIMDAVESLESYVASIQADREAGLPMTAQSAKYFTMGLVASLEAREIPSLIFTGEVTALQSSFESNASEDYSTEAEEKAQGLLMRLWNMLKTAVTAIATSFKEFFATMGKNATAIKAAGAKLKRVGSSIKGELKKGEGLITVSATSALGDGTEIDPAKGLDQLKSHYTTDVLGITKEIRTALGDLASVLKDPTPAKLSALESSIAGKAPSSKTVVLPGGYALKYVAGVGEGFAALAKAQFSVTKPTSGSATNSMGPLTPAEISALGGKIVDIGTLMETASKEVDAVIKTNDDLLKAAETAVNKAKDGTPEQVAAARAAITAAKSAINANKGLIPAYVRHLGVAGKEAYSLGMASARKYGGAAAAAPAAAAAE